MDEPIVEKVSVDDEPPELQPPPIVTDPEPEVDIESLLSATIDWKNNTEHSNKWTISSFHYHRINIRKG